jgi:3-hydroxybutyryl-CoA dehydrogenase
VIEAATENYELKVKILKQLDALLAQDVIVATNTSSISITQLAAVTSVPTVHRHALLQPRAHDGAGGDHPRPADQRRHPRRRQGPAEKLGKSPITVKNAPALWSTAFWCP